LIRDAIMNRYITQVEQSFMFCISFLHKFWTPCHHIKQENDILITHWCSFIYFCNIYMTFILSYKENSLLSNKHLPVGSEKNQSVCQAAQSTFEARLQPINKEPKGSAYPLSDVLKWKWTPAETTQHVSYCCRNWG
jgi:hypothetical protein